MPVTRKAVYGKNPFAVPEPYYLPGYTGHCPLYNNVVGQTYGRATHTVMENLPPSSCRLKKVPDNALQWLREQEEGLLKPQDLDVLNERMEFRGQSLLKADIAPGYKGYIPRSKHMIGLNFKRSCVRGVAEFERRRKELRDLLKTEKD